MEWPNKFNALDSRLYKNFRELDDFFDKLIQEHHDPQRIKPEHDDPVDVLLRIQGDAAQAITSIRFYYNHLKWSIFCLIFNLAKIHPREETIRNPVVKRKAQQQVKEAIKAKRKVEETDLSKLTYLKLVINVSLRLHPQPPPPPFTCS
ncbi:unnamed protein product [Coffea canephora]|uniref:Uncharacterized protein n=1 Tax=Coffea canephora TaxID=49390 RepID=A0A068TLJ2_COFCA|nr:unnamed protein product [Coffea canephora]